MVPPHTPTDGPFAPAPPPGACPACGATTWHCGALRWQCRQCGQYDGEAHPALTDDPRPLQRPEVG